MTNQFTDEQIDAAAMELAEGDGPLARTHFFRQYRAKALAILEAAAGVAPQAESVDRAMEIAQALAKAHTFTTASALSIANAALALAAPAQQLSTVDEAALIREAKAEALEEAAGEIYADPRGWRLGVLAENAFHAGAHAVYDALRARAAEMREVGGDDVSRGWVPSGIYESDAMNPYREGSET